MPLFQKARFDSLQTQPIHVKVDQSGPLKQARIAKIMIDSLAWIYNNELLQCTVRILRLAARMDSLVCWHPRSSFDNVDQLSQRNMSPARC